MSIAIEIAVPCAAPATGCGKPDASILGCTRDVGRRVGHVQLHAIDRHQPPRPQRRENLPRCLFALANREINLRIAEVYKTLPPPALSRFGEILSRTDEVV